MLDCGKPCCGIDVGGITESLAKQFFWFGDGRQSGVEFDTSGEFVDSDTGEDGFNHDRSFDTDEHAEWSEFAEREADGEALLEDRQLALDANEEHAIRDDRRGVVRFDDLAGGVDFQNAADQCAGNFRATEVATDLNREGLEIRDREFALLEQSNVDFQTGDGAFKIEWHAGDIADGGGNGEREVGGIILDVGPLDAEAGEFDWQP